MMKKLMIVVAGAVLAFGAFGETETSVLGQAYAGMVLQGGRRYLVDANVEIRSVFPGQAALRVLPGTTGIIEFRNGAELRVFGGSAFGALPAAPGIEVPYGAKLLLLGKGKLVAVGGNAAKGGQGYGGAAGSGGKFSEDPKAGGNTGDGYVRNGVNFTEFCCGTNGLTWLMVGAGGTGGDGGGGGAPGIGGGGGLGGEGGEGGEGRMILGRTQYEAHVDEYAKCVRFLGLSDPPYVFDGNNKRVSCDGNDGISGLDGQGGRSCGEIIVADDVIVEAQAGLAAEGGTYGSFGPPFKIWDDTFTYAHYNQEAFTIASMPIGVALMVAGIKVGLAGASAGPAGVFVGVGISIAGFVISFVQGLTDVFGVSTWNDLRKVAWMTGGGGGGGGGGGAAAQHGIGAGGGGGFFIFGPGNVYTVNGVGKPDTTQRIWDLSGGGGTGGLSANPGLGAGKSARRDEDPNATGEPERKIYEEQSKKPKYSNYKNDPGRYGGWSTHNKDDAYWAFAGKGGAFGGKAGGAYPDGSNHIYCVKPDNVIAGGAGCIPLEGEIWNTVTFCDDTETPVEQRTFVCGSLFESVPVPSSGQKGNFLGYFTESNGGSMVFNRFGHPMPGNVISRDVTLYQRWSAEEFAGGFANVREVGGSLTELASPLPSECIYRFKANNAFSNVVISSGTTVFFIDRGVTVKFKGSDACGSATGARPGIEVPEDATLIIIGEGSVEAEGGAAARGNDGSGGVGAKYAADWSGHVRMGTHYGDQGGRCQITGVAYYENSRYMLSGSGGVGGAGGAGGAPGIGGVGGVGGAGGAGGEGADAIYNATTHGAYDSSACGLAGSDGGAGGAGGACGTVYILGNVTVNAKCGGVPGDVAVGGAASDWTCVEPKNYYWAGYGGGGGGGGGGGLSAPCSIGGGGGGGGSGGITYDYDASDIAAFKLNGYGGAGGTGSVIGRSGAQRSGTAYVNGNGYNAETRAMSELGTDWGYYKAGVGGASGGAGSGGTNGLLYCGLNQMARWSQIRNEQDVRPAFGHEALQRTITFKTRDADGKESDLGTVDAMLGLPLPMLPSNITARAVGYVFSEACREQDGIRGARWYGLGGEPAIDTYDGFDDVTLYVTYSPDYWSMATLPQAYSAVYNGSNRVAFVAAENPTCAYKSGVTNAVNAGTYAYTVELPPGFTIWNDLSTESVRSNVWNICKAPITNEWTQVNRVYDWTKPPEKNALMLQSTGLGFTLPSGATVRFVTTDRVLENILGLEAHIDGGQNYLDRVLYGGYSSDSPIDMTAVSYYPWLPVIELRFTPRAKSNDEITEGEIAVIDAGKSEIESDGISSDADANNKASGGMKAFWEHYGASNLVVNAEIEGPDGVEIIPIMWSNKVSEVNGGGSDSRKFRIDLSQLPDADRLMEFRGMLQLALSIAGMPCRIAHAPVDMTYRTDDAGWPCYDLDGPDDVLPIRCSAYLPFGDWKNRMNPKLSISAPLDEAVFFDLYNGVSRIEDREIEWPRGQSGDFRLEHLSCDDQGRDCLYKAFFNIGSKAGEPGQEIVFVTRAGTDRTFGYDSLQAAVADLRYGDTIDIRGDVQLESVKIPSGVSVSVDDEYGAFRVPVASDMQRDYHRAVVSMENGRVSGVVYELDEEKVRPSVGGEDASSFGPVYNDSGKLVGFRMEIGNAKDDLAYLVRRSEDLRLWSVVRTVGPETGRGERIKVEAPAEGDASFYSVSATDEPVQEFYGSGNGDGTVTITGAVGSITGPFAGKFVIPTTIGGLTVTVIGADAFAGRTDITAVDVPDCVRTIGDRAFLNCVNLTSVSLPDDLDKIGERAFEGTAIGRLTLPANVEAGNVGVPAWRPVEFVVSNVEETATAWILGCVGVPSDGRVLIPERIDGSSVVGIWDEAFAGKTGLLEVAISASVREIGYSVFRGCSDLRGVVFMGDAPEADEDEVGLDPEKCTIYVNPAAHGWSETWCGCPVAFRGADGQLYSPLAYVKATQGAYVDTLYRPNQNTRVTMDVTVRGEMEYWFGCWTNDYNRGAFCLGNDGEWGIYFAVCDDGGSFFHDGGRVPAGRHTVELTPWEFKVDGTIWTAKPESSRKDFRLDLPLYLFAQNRKGSAFVNAEQGTITCYGCTISENGSLKRKFVPCCRESDGAYGFYDAVEGVFYGNMGSGMFYGPKDMK